MSARRILLSPLVHFLALGVLVFIAFELVNDEQMELEQPADVITLSDQDADRLIDQFSSTWKRPPTPEELDGLMQSWALEEALVREALQLGLDRGDAVIRQRLSLKMQFLAESGVAAVAADDATLQTYLDENSERFAQPARFAFEQILLPEAALDAAEEIRARLLNGEDPGQLGKPSLLPASVPLSASPIISRTFGNNFGASFGELPIGDWAGPVESGYGFHLVRVSESVEAQVPPLADIRERVETEWRAARAGDMRENFGAALLERYAVNLPAAEELLQQ